MYFEKFLLLKFKFLSRMFRMKKESAIKLDRPIVMVGLMGAGKTSVGRALAHHLGVPFVDSDKEIERAAGCSVVDIFSLYGEHEFRRVEQQVVSRLLDTPPTPKVISTGEGAFITPAVRDKVLAGAISIWLKADLDLLVKRTRFRDTRPQLLHTDSKKILAQLIAERYNTYALADITVETFDENLRKTLAKVVEALEQHLTKEQKNGNK